MTRRQPCRHLRRQAASVLRAARRRVTRPVPAVDPGTSGPTVKVCCWRVYKLHGLRHLRRGPARRNQGVSCARRAANPVLLGRTYLQVVAMYPVHGPVKPELPPSISTSGHHQPNPAPQDLGNELKRCPVTVERGSAAVAARRRCRGRVPSQDGPHPGFVPRHGLISFTTNARGRVIVHT